MESPEENLWHIGKAIRQTLSDESKSLDPIRVARQGLVEQVALRNCGPNERRSLFPFVRAGWAIAAFGLLCVAVFGLTLSRRPIGFAIDGRSSPGRPGEVIEANNNSPLAVAFTEGSALLLHEGGRMRVLSLQKDGARVLVESGALDVAIPRPPRLASWRFELGPFQVSLAGSKFRAAWDPADERLSLYVREGSVVVSGRCIGGQRTVAAGQHLNVLCPPGPAQPTALLGSRSKHARGVPGY
jgi:hypothetical protein